MERRQLFCIYVSVVVVALWLALEEEITWLGVALMKYGRYHLDLLCGLADKHVPSFCSFGGLWARHCGLQMYFPRGKRLLCNICLSHHRGAQNLCR